jgi:hypothetical protein
MSRTFKSEAIARMKRHVKGNKNAGRKPVVPMSVVLNDYNGCGGWSSLYPNASLWFKSQSIDLDTAVEKMASIDNPFISEWESTAHSILQEIEAYLGSFQTHIEKVSLSTIVDRHCEAIKFTYDNFGRFTDWEEKSGLRAARLAADKVWKQLRQSLFAFNIDQEFSSNPVIVIIGDKPIELIPVFSMTYGHCSLNRHFKIAEKSKAVLKAGILEVLKRDGFDLNQLYFAGKKELHAKGIGSLPTKNIKEYCAFFTLISSLNEKEIAQVSRYWGKSFSFNDASAGKEFISSYFATFIHDNETSHVAINKRTGEENLISFNNEIAPSDMITIGSQAYSLPDASNFVSWSNSLLGSSEYYITQIGVDNPVYFMDEIVRHIVRFLTLQSSDSSIVRGLLFSSDYFDKSLGLANLRCLSVVEATVYHEDLSDDFHGYYNNEQHRFQLAPPLFSNKGWSEAEELHQDYCSYTGSCMIVVPNKSAIVCKKVEAYIPEKTGDARKDVINFFKLFGSSEWKQKLNWLKGWDRSNNEYSIVRDVTNIAALIFPILNAFIKTNTVFEESDLSCRTCVKLQVSADTKFMTAFSEFFSSTLRYALDQTSRSSNSNLNSKYFKTWVNYFSLLSQKTEEEKNEEYRFLEDLNQMVHASDTYAYYFFYESVIEGNIPYIKSVMAKLPIVVAAFNKLISQYSPIQLSHCPPEFVSPCGTITFRREEKWEVYQEAAIFINETYDNNLCVANGTYSHGFNIDHVGYIGTSIVGKEETIVSILIANNSGILDYGYWGRNRSHEDSVYTENYIDKVQEQINKIGFDSKSPGSRLPEGVDFATAANTVGQLYKYIGMDSSYFETWLNPLAVKEVKEQMPLNPLSVKKNLNKNFNWWYENLHTSFLLLSRAMAN